MIMAMESGENKMSDDTIKIYVIRYRPYVLDENSRGEIFHRHPIAGCINEIYIDKDTFDMRKRKLEEDFFVYGESVYKGVDIEGLYCGNVSRIYE